MRAYADPTSRLRPADPRRLLVQPDRLRVSGYGGSLGFADPANGLAFGYVMNRIQEGVPDRRASTLLEAVHRAIKARGR
ncbi:hypothetical protein [Microtetraspora fusca]|uniref:hypothetical protein n=1 Tax=Microtetraspora fusca TaxID=1997 RepID=UPI0008350143|nr:hypothetical protein [Microtetraspora fusca]